MKAMVFRKYCPPDVLEIRIRDGSLVAVTPRQEYAPLFAYNI